MRTLLWMAPVCLALTIAVSLAAQDAEDTKPAKEEKNPAADFLSVLTDKAVELGLTDPDLGDEKKAEALAALQDWLESKKWIGRTVTWKAAYVSKGQETIQSMRTKLEPQLQKARKAVSAAEFDHDFALNHRHIKPADRQKRVKETAARLEKCRRELDALEKRVTDVKDYPFVVRAKFVAAAEGDTENALKIGASVHRKHKPAFDALKAGAEVTLKGKILSAMLKGAGPVFEVELDEGSLE